MSASVGTAVVLAVFFVSLIVFLLFLGPLIFVLRRRLGGQWRTVARAVGPKFHSSVMITGNGRRMKYVIADRFDGVGVEVFLASACRLPASLGRHQV